MKHLLPLCATLIVLQSCTSLQKTYLNPFSVKPSGYTHVVVTDCARTIYISGQVPTNAQGDLIGKDDFAAQTRQVFENLKVTLEAAGATFNDVVKMNTYIKNYTPEQISILRSIRSNYLSKDNPPASTLAGVQSLYHPDVLIEIEAIAVIQK